MNGISPPGLEAEHAPNALPVDGTAEQVRAFAVNLTELMNALLEITDRETELVRTGRLGEAGRLTQQKSALAGRFLAEMVRLRTHADAWFKDCPELREALRQRHELFRALLQVNLTVLATAHAVAEGLVRGATGEATRKALPQTYGASGHAVTPSAKSVQPVALSRAL